LTLALFPSFPIFFLNLCRDYRKTPKSPMNPSAQTSLVFSKQMMLVLSVLLLLSQLVFSQGFYNQNRNRNFLISAGTGTAHYYGDLARDGDHFQNLNPNFAIGARLNFYRWLSAGAEVTWFMLRGDDANDPGKAIRNLSFQSHNFEVSAFIQISAFEEDRRFYARNFANPFLYAGVGFVNFNPTAELEGQRYNLRKLNTSGENYSNIALSFPAGAGVKFRVNAFFNIVVDGGYRFLLTDNLDDVSNNVYPDPASFSDEVARKLSDRTYETLPPGTPTWAEQGKHFRGNPQNNDGYFIFNIKVEYYLTEIGINSTYRRRIKSMKSGKVKAPKRSRIKGRIRRY
jgi:hypothetical protein